MKKKIKDLTNEEAQNICDSSWGCTDCPIRNTTKCIEYECVDENKEIEVEE